MTDKKSTITVSLDMEAIGRIDKMAQKIGISRAKVAANLFSASIPQIKLFDGIGLLRFGSWIEWLLSQVKRHNKELEIKAVEVEKKTITITVPKEELEYVSKIAKKFLFTKSKFAANIIVANLPTYDFLNTVGVVDAVMFFQSLTERAKTKSEDKLKKKGIIN